MSDDYQHHEPDTTPVAGLSYVDRCALAYAVAAQIVTAALPGLAAESVPLLDDSELPVLVERLYGIAGDLRSQAGERGTIVWRSVQ